MTVCAACPVFMAAKIDTGGAGLHRSGAAARPAAEHLDGERR